MLYKNCMDDETLHKIKMALLYTAGTAAVGAGAAYLYDKEYVKRKIHNQAHRIQKNLENKSIPEAPKGFFQVNPTMTPSGPGVMASAGPVGFNAHPTGVGMSVNMHRNTLARAASKIPFVGEHAESMANKLPPRVFAGVDVGVGSPLTGGMVVDKQGRVEAINHLKNLKRAMKDPNLEKKLDKKIYKKVRSMGHSIMPGVINKAAHMNKIAYMEGYMNKKAEPISSALLGGLALYSGYDAAKRVPKVYQAAKAGDSREAWRQGGLTALSGLGAVPMAGQAMRSVRKGGEALSAMKGAAGKGATLSEASGVGHKAVGLGEANEMMNKAIKLDTAAGGKVPTGWYNYFSKGRRANRYMDEAVRLEQKANAATTPATGMWGKTKQTMGNINYAPSYYEAKYAPGMAQKHADLVARASKTAPWKAGEWAGQNWAPILVGQMGGETALGGQ